MLNWMVSSVCRSSYIPSTFDVRRKRTAHFSRQAKGRLSDGAPAAFDVMAGVRLNGERPLTVRFPLHCLRSQSRPFCPAGDKRPGSAAAWPPGRLSLWAESILTDSVQFRGHVGLPEEKFCGYLTRPGRIGCPGRRWHDVRCLENTLGIILWYNTVILSWFTLVFSFHWESLILLVAHVFFPCLYARMCFVLVGFW